MNRVLVTGAGSGLGRAIAARYRRAGARVLLTDVDPVAGRAAAAELGGDFAALDVRDDADWRRVHDWCLATYGGLDLLVNNAGVGAGGRLERLDWSDWQWVLDINLAGVVRGCRTFVPLFQRQRRGHLVNVASMAGLLNPPGMASYNVSKAAVVALSETLRTELAPDGITTTVVCPGYFATNLGTRLRCPDPAMTALANRLMARSAITADDVAEQVFAAVTAGRFWVLPHREGRRAWWLKRHLPALTQRRLAADWARLLPRLRADGPVATATGDE